MKENKPTAVTPAHIKEWKSKHPVSEVVVPVDDEGNSVTGYFRKPDLEILGAAGKFAETDPIRSGLVMFDNCFLGGDPAFVNNDEVKMSAIKVLNNWFKIRTAIVKNL